MTFKDDYKPLTACIGDVEYELAEEDYHILRNRRKELKLTQQDVANLSDIQLRQYQRFESGERHIYSASLTVALHVCKALRLDPYRFVPDVWDS